MSGQEYRVGIIGCGSIFPLHAAAVAEMANTRLVCVCDIVSEKARAAAKEHSCRGYQNWQKMLDSEELDAVHICLPHYLHYPVSEYALKKGLSVLVEKPVTILPEHAQRLIELSERTGGLLGVVYQNRFNEASKLIKKRLGDGRLGRVISARCYVDWARDDKYYLESGWRGTWDKEGGGITINQAIHTLDLLLWFMPSEAEWVRASIQNHMHKNSIEVEDTSEGIISFENGARALFHLSNCNVHDIEVELSLCCERGSVDMQGSFCVINYSDGTSELPPVDESLERPCIGKDCWGNSHRALTKDFYDALSGGREPFVTAESALKTQRLVAAVYESAKTGDMVWLQK